MLFYRNLRFNKKGEESKQNKMRNLEENSINNNIKLK